MGRTLRLLFNLHPGEGRRASLFIILALLWSVGSYGTFVLSEGMFLEHVGAHALPKAYLAIALCMCLLSSLLLFALHRVPIRFLLFSIITLWIVFNLTFYFLLPSHGNTLTYWYLFKTVGWIVPISIYIVFWAFVDQYYDLQDAKRFFCLFNSMTFAGDALGGGIISLFLHKLGMGGLMLLFTLSMVASLPFIFLITRSLSPVLEEHTESIDTPSSINLKSILNTLFKSKFTLYLILFYFAMQLLAIVTEFNYMESFERTFMIFGANALTEFIGRCGMWISIGNMCLGMFFYSRLVKKLGVNNIILVAPTFFAMIFAAWLFKDVLAIAICGMIAREGMVYTFDDNNLQLLISGVPTKLKNHVRITVESFIEPTGMFVGAFLLLFWQRQGLLLGGALSLTALLIVFFLRSTYPRAIFQNLVATSIRFEKKASDFIRHFTNKERRASEFLLLSNLKKYEEKSQLIAYEYLLEIGNERVLPRLLNHIGKLTLPGKLTAIELLSKSKWAHEPIVLERLERWRRILPHPAIKSAIHFYLAAQGSLRPERIMHDLNNDNLGLRAAAILTLKTSPHAFQFPSFCSLASEKLRVLLESKQEQEISIGLRILGLEKDPANINSLFEYLKHPSLTVNRAAAEAISLVAHPDYKEQAHQIIARLPYTPDQQVRKFCLEALEKLANPEAVRPLILASVHFHPSERNDIERLVLNLEEPPTSALLQLVQSNNVHERCRLLAGKILGKFNKKALGRHLFTIVRREIERAYFYFYHAHVIQQQLPEHDLSILQNTLLTRYHSIIDFIIQMLGIAGSIEECEVLSHTLRNPNRKIQAQAIESLEKSCDAHIFSLLLPLIDKGNPEVKLRHYIKTGGVPLNLTQLLDVMANSPSTADQVISIAMKAHLKTPDWRYTLREKLEGEEEIFHHFANELLETSHA